MSTNDRPPSAPPWLRLLPLLILAVMVTIAVGIEALLLSPADGGKVQWGVKLPLVLLIAAALLHRPPAPGA